MSLRIVTNDSVIEKNKTVLKNQNHLLRRQVIVSCGSGSIFVKFFPLNRVGRFNIFFPQLLVFHLVTSLDSGHPLSLNHQSFYCSKFVLSEAGVYYHPQNVSTVLVRVTGFRRSLTHSRILHVIYFSSLKISPCFSSMNLVKPKRATFFEDWPISQL